MLQGADKEIDTSDAGGYEPLAPNLAKVNPFSRLKWLKRYIEKKVDKWPDYKMSFVGYMLYKHAKDIPGTMLWARKNATHCYYCNRRLKEGDEMKKATIDHYYPKKARTPDNRFVIVCSSCNLKKSNMMPEAFTAKIVKGYTRGLGVFGFDIPTVKIAFERTRKINSDILHHTGPKIYFIKK